MRAKLWLTEEVRLAVGRHVEIIWQESEAELKQRYQHESHRQRRTRLQALWLMRQGKSMGEVAQVVAIHPHTLQTWAAWYREGGLGEVLRRLKGQGAGGHNAYLTPLQQKTLRQQVANGRFKSVWEAIGWVTDRWGIEYSADGMYALLARQRAKLKIPRPQAAKADVQQQERWKKGG